MPPQFVRPYVKTNKNDAADAEACCEAVRRPGMRFVPTKTVEQQTAMALHRVRDHLVRQRTATINALRGHLAEYGVVARLMRTDLKQLFDLVIDEEDQSMAAELKPVLRMLVDEIQAVDVRIAELDRRMKDAARTNEACRRLVEVPGIGPLIATAIVAAVPNDHRSLGSG
jgi:transposase